MVGATEVAGALDIGALVKEFGPFIALVVFVLWANYKREEKSNARENRFIDESQKREEKYIEREDKYIDVIESLSGSFEQLSKDVTEIKERLG